MRSAFTSCLLALAAGLKKALEIGTGNAVGLGVPDRHLRAIGAMMTIR